MSGPAVLSFDPGAAYPEVAALRSALAARDWPACRRILDAAEPAARSELVLICGEERDLEEFLREAWQGDPSDSGAAAMLGSFLTREAWRIRTTGPATSVSRKQWAGFHDRLRQAERVLVKAAARNPYDPAVWVCRIVTSRGLELSIPETRRRYDRLSAHHPHHLPGQLGLVQQLCPKWGGDWAQLHTFTREAMHAAPPGAHSAVVVAEGHIEQWVDNQAPVAYGAHGPGHLSRVSGEIYEAAQRSVWHPDFRRTVGWVRVMSTFAMVFSLLGDHRAAGSLFAVLGPFADERPWSYLGSPGRALRSRRAGAMRAWEASR
ncbi:hypothetical protein ACQPZX_04175 [Actinoplanes sp. CA-142083]|uniref:hypothetical protein n=1 Tax=Actinoplanes sp. CA-142083 TaxID=3239903 RepID=UPI003D9358AB